MMGFVKLLWHEIVLDNCTAWPSQHCASNQNCHVKYIEVLGDVKARVGQGCCRNAEGLYRPEVQLNTLTSQG